MKNNINVQTIMIENIRFKAQVLEMPKVPVDWEKVQMHTQIITELR
jgi:hypothetical protein